jgi:hypothetical protein
MLVTKSGALRRRGLGVNEFSAFSAVAFVERSAAFALDVSAERSRGFRF